MKELLEYGLPVSERRILVWIKRKLSKITYFETAITAVDANPTIKVREFIIRHFNISHMTASLRNEKAWETCQWLDKVFYIVLSAKKKSKTTCIIALPSCWIESLPGNDKQRHQWQVCLKTKDSEFMMAYTFITLIDNHSTVNTNS